MGKKMHGRELRQRAESPKDSSPKITGSLRSQRSVKEEWRLESILTTCKAQIGLWERNLATAREGVTRQSARVSAGIGTSHSILKNYVEDVANAERMISAFKEQAATLRSQIDALLPDAAKAAERAEEQKVLAGQVLARLEIDRKLDFALDTVRQILRDRGALTSQIREGAMSLEFERGLDLDGERFDALLRMLLQEIAIASEKFVQWFLGQGNRSPYTVAGGEFVLPETLHSHNAFRSGDCPSLTEEEVCKLDALAASRIPDDMSRFLNPERKPGVAAQEQTGTIVWSLMR